MFNYGQGTSAFSQQNCSRANLSSRIFHDTTISPVGGSSSSHHPHNYNIDFLMSQETDEPSAESVGATAEEEEDEIVFSPNSTANFSTYTHSSRQDHRHLLQRSPATPPHRLHGEHRAIQLLSSSSSFVRRKEQQKQQRVPPPSFLKAYSSHKKRMSSGASNDSSVKTDRPAATTSSNYYGRQVPSTRTSRPRNTSSSHRSVSSQSTQQSKWEQLLQQHESLSSTTALQLSHSTASSISTNPKKIPQYGKKDVRNQRLGPGGISVVTSMYSSDSSWNFEDELRLRHLTSNDEGQHDSTASIRSPTATSKLCSQVSKDVSQLLHRRRELHQQRQERRQNANKSDNNSNWVLHMPMD
jgi:hypothetical protein